MVKEKFIIDEGVLNKIREISFFKMYRDNDEVIENIANMCSHRSFKKGKTIIKEGDNGDDLYIILTGEIDILKNTMQNEKYTVTTLDASKGGVYVGELALIDNDRRSASVVAKTDCDCLVLDRDDFIRFGDENPGTGLNITRSIAGQLSSKLRKTNTDVITLFSALVEEISSIE